MNIRHVIVLSALLVWSGACSIAKTPAPPLTGPSELNLSLTLAARPDMIAENVSASPTSSTSTIAVVARDGNGQPVANKQLRVDIVSQVNSNTVVMDAGTLSTSSISTDSSGSASLVYIAPLVTQPGVDLGRVAVIRMIPLDTDFANARPRYLSIRVVPPTIVTVPGGPTASFTMPTTGTRGVGVLVNASASSDSDGVIVRYKWAWGDGDMDEGSSPTQDHFWSAPGSYFVTLTVVDNDGKEHFVTKSIVIS